MLKNANVLVTGAGGFIGSHLCERLVECGASVTAMLHYSSRPDWGNLEDLSSDTKSQIKVTAGNIEDSDFVLHSVTGADVVFHLAALIAIPYSYIAPRSYVRTNIEGTLNVMEACRRLSTPRVVHTSTSEVYGTACYMPIDEKHPLQGQSPYSASKIGADKVVESYARSFNLPVVTVRPFNTFGPRQSARALIPTVISQALAEPEIRLGSLDPLRDLTFVTDTVRGFIMAAEAADHVNGQEINLGVGKAISVGDLTNRILGKMNVSKPVLADAMRLRPPKSEVLHLISDNSKAQRLLGWAPTVSLDDGLAQTIEAIRQNIHRYKRGIYAI